MKKLKYKVYEYNPAQKGINMNTRVEGINLTIALIMNKFNCTKGCAENIFRTGYRPTELKHKSNGYKSKNSNDGTKEE